MVVSGWKTSEVAPPFWGPGRAVRRKRQGRTKVTRLKSQKWVIKQEKEEDEEGQKTTQCQKRSPCTRIKEGSQTME